MCDLQEAPEETTTPAETATPTGTCAPQQTEECHTRGAPKLEAAAEEKLEKPTQEVRAIYYNPTIGSSRALGKGLWKPHPVGNSTMGSGPKRNRQAKTRWGYTLYTKTSAGVHLIGEPPWLSRPHVDMYCERYAVGERSVPHAAACY